MANILLLPIFSFLVSFHPLYVSVTEIEHDSKEKRLEITMRIFIDDLELSIKNKVNQPYLDITQPGDGYSTDKFIEDYLQGKLKIKLNGKEKEVEYIGHEVELPVVFIYAQVSNVKKFKEISVFNSMIMETYDTQTNLVHVESNGETKSLKLTEKRKEDQLVF
ncbi:MAG: DUF6702 family protein [Candidatus Cyclobacteriaceae bacterium M2_1C_046]